MSTTPPSALADFASDRRRFIRTLGKLCAALTQHFYASMPLTIGTSSAKEIEATLTTLIDLRIVAEKQFEATEAEFAVIQQHNAEWQAAQQANSTPPAAHEQSVAHAEKKKPTRKKKAV